jgi:hypothetical protein
MNDTLSKSFADGVSKAFAGTNAEDPEGHLYVNQNTTPDSGGDQKPPDPNPDNSKGSEAPDNKPAGDGSLNQPGTTKAEEGSGDKKNEVGVPSFEDLLAERSGGKFKAWEDLEKELNAPREVFANEEVKAFNEFSKDFDDPNVALDLFIEHKTNDYDEMDEMACIVMQESIDNPELSQDDIRLLLEDKYRINDWNDEDEDENDASRLGNARINADGLKARKFLKEQQAKILSQHKRPDPKVLEGEAKKEQEAWEKSVSSSLKGMDKMPLKVDGLKPAEGEPINFNVDFSLPEEEQRAIRESALVAGQDMIKALLPYLKDETGNMSHRKLGEVFYKIRNYDKAIKVAAEHAFNLGQKAVAKDLKNVQFSADGGSVSPSDSPDKAQSKSLASQMQKAGL